MAHMEDHICRRLTILEKGPDRRVAQKDYSK